MKILIDTARRRTQVFTFHSIPLHSIPFHSVTVTVARPPAARAARGTGRSDERARIHPEHHLDGEEDSSRRWLSAGEGNPDDAAHHDIATTTWPMSMRIPMRDM
jgi:hypothetical protein